MYDVTKEAFLKATEVLQKCSTKHGFNAASPGYDALWSRDSIITSLGASLLGNKFQNTFKQSLITLAKNQSKKGQIPNAVDTFSFRRKHVDYKSIDSSLWFIIGHSYYKRRYGDLSLVNSYGGSIAGAFTWLTYQDMGEDLMLEQLPTTDWQDAFPHRYGHTINTQALYYKVLNILGRTKEAKALKKMVNDNREDGLWNGNYYLPWRWKNHNNYKELGSWFDSLGNLLAIVFELADKKRANRILNYIKEKNIASPYPMKSIYPPINRESKDWQDYFLDCEARTPYHYSNGGIWTFIGGFYVLSLIKLKRYKEAQHQLIKLAHANLLKPEFSEWLHGKSGIPGNAQSGSKEGNQAWNAGMYVLAYLSMQKKKCLL
jgi:glycogen debranching enzyme